MGKSVIRRISIEQDEENLKVQKELEKIFGFKPPYRKASKVNAYKDKKVTIPIEEIKGLLID